MKLKIITIIIFVSLLVYFIPAHASDDLKVSLTWQTNTLTPENYQGRPLPIRGSTITVFAFPAMYNSSNLIFDWYLDRTYMRYSSGKGKDTFVFTATKWSGAEHNIRVKISDEKKTVSGYASMSIEIQKPELHVFKNGKYENDYTVNSGSSNAFLAVPYFFNLLSMESLTYKWYINNQEVENTGSLSSPEKFTLDIAQNSRSAKYRISAVAQNKRNLIEKAVCEFKVLVK